VGPLFCFDLVMASPTKAAKGERREVWRAPCAAAFF
jgi:hypothetical protein